MSYPHLGKFEGELYATKYAYESGLDSCDDEIGEVDGFGWYGCFSDKIKGRGPFHIILHENSQGFVTGSYYDTAGDLGTAWSALESEYEKYCAEEDEPEEDEPEEDDAPVCPVCAGESYPLGKLGSRVHYCCRACGAEFSEVQI